jgi:hypothetical protein
LNTFTSNLALLSRRQPELARLLRADPAGRVRLAQCRKGATTAFYQRASGDSVPLHSRYDPLLEAQKSLQDVDLTGADYFIFMGFGLGYNLDALLARVSRETAHIFVVESDLEILRAAMAARDLSAFLSLPYIHFAWPPGGNELGEQWRQFFDPVTASKSVYIINAASLVLNPELFKSATEIIQSKTLQIFMDINTLVGMSTSFLHNFVANFPRACKAPGVDAFAAKFSGVPAILVSAGPSLDRNVHELRAHQDNALIIAADAALKPLNAAGIEPHFVVCGDPGYETFLHLKDSNAPTLHLVAEGTVYPESLAAFENRTILCTFENTSLPGFSDLLSSKGSLRTWGSVATMCLDFALRLGCNPILFMGQDLAFSDGRTYCSGLHWEPQWFQGVCGPEEWKMRWSDLRESSKLVPMRDLFGRLVESTDKLVSYWNWISAEIEKHPSVRFVNATEGGILKDHVDIMSLREALHRFCRQRCNLAGEIRRLYDDAATNLAPVDARLLVTMGEESGRLQLILEQAFHECRDGQPLQPAAQLSERLEGLKKSVLSLPRLAPLLEKFNQLGNVSFLRRRSVLASQSRVTACEIRDLYHDYFRSIAKASGPITQALTQLKSCALQVENLA